MTSLSFALVFLAIAFVAVNILWLFFLRWLITTQITERWQLQERIREPDIEHVPIGDLVKRASESVLEPKDPEFVDDKPPDEFDLVGRIDPDTPLRRHDEDESNGATS